MKLMKLFATAVLIAMASNASASNVFENKKVNNFHIKGYGWHLAPTELLTLIEYDGLKCEISEFDPNSGARGDAILLDKNRIRRPANEQDFTDIGSYKIIPCNAKNDKDLPSIFNYMVIFLLTEDPYTNTIEISCKLTNTCGMDIDDLAQMIVDNKPIKELDIVFKELKVTYKGIALDGQLVEIFPNSISISQNRLNLGSPQL